MEMQAVLSEGGAGAARIRLDGRVAIVTGAGGGLGRSHALQLAARGARVVVNDVGPGCAERVAAQIRAVGGEAMASPVSITDERGVQEMVAQALDRWQRVDILVNNAGILRDKTFSKMSMADFRDVIEVHLMGSVHCTKAVWDTMKAQRYGRVVMTTSSSGLYGSFGQANYSAAKMALVGLMQTLALEGMKHDIRVNALAPSAATQMTQDILNPDDLALLTPESVTPGLLYLVSEDAPTRTILCAGAGAFACSHITLTRGIFVGERPDAAELLAGKAASMMDPAGGLIPATGIEQSRREVAKARRGGNDMTMA